jgi:uncharacterized protein YbjT (DUF2867 family)
MMKVFVTGATGTVGAHLVSELTEKGVEVKALTRNPERAVFPKGVESIKGDLMHPESFAEYLVGVDSLYLISSSDKLGAELQTNPTIISLAQEAGVKKVALLSVLGDEELKEAIQASTLQWTFIEAVGFMANALEMNGWKEAIQKGEGIRELGLNNPGAVIHEADIASVFATVLLEEGHHQQTYQITGPEALTVAEQLTILSEVLETPIKYEEKSVEEAKENWKEEGYTEEDIEFFIQMALNPPEVGYTVLPTVKELTGRPARTFREWAEENKEAFRVTGD